MHSHSERIAFAFQPQCISIAPALHPHPKTHAFAQKKTYLTLKNPPENGNKKKVLPKTGNTFRHI